MIIQKNPLYSAILITNNILFQKKIFTFSLCRFQKNRSVLIEHTLKSKKISFFFFYQIIEHFSWFYKGVWGRVLWKIFWVNEFLKNVVSFSPPAGTNRVNQTWWLILSKEKNTEVYIFEIPTPMGKYCSQEFVQKNIASDFLWTLKFHQ